LKPQMPETMCCGSTSSGMSRPMTLVGERWRAGYDASLTISMTRDSSLSVYADLTIS